jgi:hypothetical protein
MRGARRLEEGDRALEVRAGLVRAGSNRSRRPGSLVQLGLNERLVRQLDRALECPLRLGVRRQRRGPFPSPEEHLAGFRTDPLSVGIVGGGRVRVEVMRGDDLDRLVLPGA